MYLKFPFSCAKSKGSTLFGALLMALFVVTTFVACSDDDDDSNSYGGKSASISVRTPGTLNLLLDEDVQHISVLKISGSIDGDDILCLRQMMRCEGESTSEWGMLAELDLSKASIVAGGVDYTTKDNVLNNYVFENSKSLEKISLPNDLVEIGACAFDGCAYLSSISMPKAISAIGDYAFRGCTSLKSITLPDSLFEISRSLFYQCENLTSVSMSKYIDYIGDYAFYGCNSLKSISLKNVATIGRSAFYECYKLSSIELSSNLTRINDYTFYKCESLKSVTIGDRVTRIGEDAFYYCTGMTTLTLGAAVSYIDYHGFAGCSSLTSISSRNSTPPSLYSSNVFDEVDKEHCSLKVPKGCADLYKAANVWGDFGSIKDSLTVSLDSDEEKS